MFSSFLKRVPWEKFFLLWFLALLMGTSLLWLHYGFTARILKPEIWLLLGTAAGLLWGTTRPRWEKTHCSWCGAKVSAKAMRFDRKRGGWVTVYSCAKCGHLMEKSKGEKGLKVPTMKGKD